MQKMGQDFGVVACFTFQGFNVKSRASFSRGFSASNNFKSGPRLRRLKPFSALKCFKYRPKLGNLQRLPRLPKPKTHGFSSTITASVSCEVKEQPRVLCWTLYLRNEANFHQIPGILRQIPQMSIHFSRKRRWCSDASHESEAFPPYPRKIWAFPTVFCWKLQARTSLLPYLDFSKSGNAWFFGNKMVVPTNLMK